MLVRALTLVGLLHTCSGTYWDSFWAGLRSSSSSPSSSSHLSLSTTLPPSPRTAYSTLLYDADDQRIGLVRTLASSIRKEESMSEFVVFATEDLSTAHMKALTGDSINVIKITPLDMPWTAHSGSVYTLVDVREGTVTERAAVPKFHESWRFVFSKLQLFAVQQFDQIVVLDYDMLVQQSIQAVLNEGGCPDWAGMCMIEEGVGYGNGGFAVIRPNLDRYADLMDAFLSLANSNIVLKYAEQDFWNVYATQDDSFMSLLPVANNCPGNCGDLVAPFPQGCYLDNPNSFPLLHFCGVAKPNLCTRTDVASIWLDYCLSPAASNWLDAFYSLTAPCGDDQACAHTNPTQTLKSRKTQSIMSELTATGRRNKQEERVKHRVHMLADDPYNPTWSVTWRVTVPVALANNATWKAGFASDVTAKFNKVVVVVSVEASGTGSLITFLVPDEVTKNSFITAAKGNGFAGSIYASTLDPTYSPPAAKSNSSVVIGAAVGGAVAFLAIIIVYCVCCRGRAKPAGGTSNNVELSTSAAGGGSHRDADGFQVFTFRDDEGKLVVIDDRNLPAGWRLIENNGNPYYWNDDTEESRWDKPT